MKIFTIKKYNALHPYNGTSKVVHYHLKIKLLFSEHETSVHDTITFYNNNYLIANDYCMNAVKPAVKYPFDVNEFRHCKHGSYMMFDIHTKYNSKVCKFNRKFKKYCKLNKLHYIPYRLCIIKKDNDICYHLHNEEYFEMYESKSLKTLINKFEKYVNGLLTNSKEHSPAIRQNLTKLDKHRNKLINNEIDRTYQYIKNLKKLKK